MLKRIILALLLCLSLFIAINLPQFFRGQQYFGEISDHFDGKKFYNKAPMPAKRKSFFMVALTEEKGEWPESIHVNQLEKEHILNKSTDLRIYMVNHSTILIQTNGVNILTDPIWSERASPFTWIGPKRHALPGINFEDLPKIDLVLISHNHYDHFDIATLKMLDEKFNPLILTGLGNDTLLKEHNLNNVITLDWWGSHKFNDDITINFVPAQHFSARGFTDRFATLWGGFVIQSTDKNLFFAGDTGYSNHFKEIKKKFGKIDVAMTPIAAYEPRWFMKYMHTNPHEAVQAHLDLEAEYSIAIHFGTFRLAFESYEQIFKDFDKALKDLEVSPQEFLLLRNGEYHQF